MITEFKGKKTSAIPDWCQENPNGYLLELRTATYSWLHSASLGGKKKHWEIDGYTGCSSDADELIQWGKSKKRKAEACCKCYPNGFVSLARIKYSSWPFPTGSRSDTTAESLPSRETSHRRRDDDIQATASSPKADAPASIGDLHIEEPQQIDKAPNRSLTASDRIPPQSGTLPNTLTAFSWGYWGWGTEVERFLEAAAAHEAAAGFDAPAFADVRLKRAVRAKSFSGNALEQIVGQERYRWFSGLGNAHIITDRTELDEQIEKVAAPLVVNDEAVRLAVIEKLGWIKRQKAGFAEQPRQSQREIVNGESHYFLGQRYRLRVHEHDATARVAVRGVASLDLFVRPGTNPDQREALLLRWHREQLKVLIQPLLEKWQPILGVQVADWGIKKMKTKWGSCNAAARRVWFNLELAKKPVQCLEYIVVHKLVHLLERHHNERFMALMETHIPQWRQHREMLNRTRLGHEDSRWNSALPAKAISMP